MENWIDLFSYKKRERRGIFVLFLLVLLFAITTFLVSNWSKSKPVVVNELLEQKYEQLLKDTIAMPQEQKYEKRYKVKKEPVKIAQVQKMPVEKTIKKEPSSVVINKSPLQEKKYIAPPKPVVLDINRATATEFAQLRGIGEVLSNRIVKYREKLGGFISVEQVGTTYGIESSVFLEIKSNLKQSESYEIKTKNFNTESAEQLASHPYISKKLASQIVNFRTKVKPYESFADIEKLYYFKNQPDLLKKLKPYISY